MQDYIINSVDGKDVRTIPTKISRKVAGRMLWHDCTTSRHHPRQAQMQGVGRLPSFSERGLNPVTIPAPQAVRGPW